MNKSRFLKKDLELNFLKEIEVYIKHRYYVLEMSLLDIKH
jgi:hypothetical protein